jgi:hypothetical protein
MRSLFVGDLLNDYNLHYALLIVFQQQHSSQVQLGHFLADVDSLHSCGVQLQSAQFMDMIL